MQTRWLQKKALVSVVGGGLRQSLSFFFLLFILQMRLHSERSARRVFFGCQPLLVVRRLETGRELTRTLKLMRVLDASQSSSELMLLRRPQGINRPPTSPSPFFFFLFFFLFSRSVPLPLKAAGKERNGSRGLPALLRQADENVS